jgi:CheY-like chemotaxis protein
LTNSNVILRRWERFQRIEALARQAHPALAIVDIGLPGMDSYQIAAALRAEPALAPMRLLALTGYGQPADRARALAAGFERH